MTLKHILLILLFSSITSGCLLNKKPSKEETFPKDKLLNPTKLLIKENCDLSLPPIQPLHRASYESNYNEMLHLIKNNTDVNQKGSICEGWRTPLHYATISGDIKSTSILLKNKAQTNIKDISGQTPLFYSATNLNIEITSMLLDNGADINSNKKHHLLGLAILMPHYRIQYNKLRNKDKHIEMISLLLKHGVNTNEPNNDDPPLQAAASEGLIKIAHLLIKYGANVNHNLSTTALFWASVGGHSEMVKLLIKNGAEINLKNKKGRLTALDIAIYNGHSDTTALLLKYGANINQEGKRLPPPLHLAIQKNNFYITSLLIKNKANINLKDKRGNTPLHIAALKVNVDIISILIENGANINSKNNHGRTPLHFASSLGKKNIVSFLVQNGSNLELKSKDGFSAVEESICKGYKSITSILLKNGAKTQIKNKHEFILLYKNRRKHRKIASTLSQNEDQQSLATRDQLLSQEDCPQVPLNDYQ